MSTVALSSPTADPAEVVPPTSPIPGVVPAGADFAVAPSVVVAPKGKADGESDDDDADAEVDDAPFRDDDEPDGFNDGLAEKDDIDEFDDIDEEDFDDDFDDDFEEELKDDYEIEIDDEISAEFGLNSESGDDEDPIDDELDDFEDFENVE